MQKEIEIIKDGLSYSEELECIAKRFGMTQEQTLKEIIHEIYTSSVTFTGLQTAMVLIGDYEEKVVLLSMTLTEELYLMITVAESLTYLIVIPLSKMQTEVSMKQNHEFINFRLLVFCYA